MVERLRIDWERPPDETRMTLESFDDILKTRIASVTFTPMHVDGLLLNVPDRRDHLGRNMHKIAIDSNDPEEEQAKTLVHEVAHIHHPSPFANLLEEMGAEANGYEDFIEEETERLFAENAEVIIQRFRSFLTQANSAHL